MYRSLFPCRLTAPAKSSVLFNIIGWIVDNITAPDRFTAGRKTVMEREEAP
jgi:hypothetical protein